MRACLARDSFCYPIVKDECSSRRALGCPTRSGTSAAMHAADTHFRRPTQPWPWLLTNAQARPWTTDIPWPAQVIHASPNALPEHRMTSARSRIQNVYRQSKPPDKSGARSKRIDATPNFDPTRFRSTRHGPRKAHRMTLETAVPLIREARRPRVPLTRS
jgi:hypothetical protein